jgi:hypothetical protein
VPIPLLDSKSDKKLLEFLRPGIDTLVTTNIHQDVDREKIVQYANARRNDLYYAGKQYIFPTFSAGGSQVVDYTSTGNLVTSAGTQGRTYDYVLNYFRGDGDKAIAVLSQKPPTVKGMPDRIDDDAAIRRSRIADLFAGVMRSHWRMEEIVRHIALSLWKNGTTFLYTPWVANASRYGTTVEPVIDLELQFDQTTGEEIMLPVPKLNADGSEMVREYENGSVECVVGTIFDVTTPFYIKSLAEAPWLWYEYEMHKGSLMAAFPELREMLRNDAGTSSASTSTASGQLARDTASSPSKSMLTPRMNRWLYSRYWLRPAMYELLAQDGGKQDELYKELKKNFPEGAKVTMVQGKLVRIEHERLDEVWTAIKPRASEYLYADPLGDDFIGPQDVINDMFNIMVETAERSMPITLINSRMLDQEALRRQRANPSEFMAVNPQYANRMQDAMYTPPTAKMEPGVTQVGGMALEAGRQNSGVLPALFGGSDGKEQTAREAQMKRDQALMQFSTTWNYIRTGVAGAHENAAIQAARFSNGTFYTRRSASMPPERIDMPEIVELAEGGWHYESGENIPMTNSERRDRVQEFLTSGNDAVINLIGIADPDNLPTLQEMFGMADWKVPNLDALYKVRDTIRELSQQEPIMGQPMIDPMSGMPVMGEPQPSIPADEFEDNHDFVVAVVKNWAQTQKALELRATNPAGYDNVILWAKQHAQIAAMQMAAMQPPPEGDEAQDGAAPNDSPQGPQSLLPPGPEGAPQAAPPADAMAGQAPPPMIQ